MKSITKWIRSIFFKKNEIDNEQNPKSILAYPSQKAAYPFCLAAFLLFGLQGLVATAGSFELVFPALPTPIPFQAGRAIHLNLSTYWPLLGIMGATYYFFCRETKNDLFNSKLIPWHFGLTFLLILGILLSISLQYTEGREYLEAIWPLRMGIFFSIVFFTFILIGSLYKAKTKKSNPILIAVVAGAVSLSILYLPNLFFYSHPTVDEMVKFWVVHIWEEMSFELIGTGLIAAWLISVAQINRKTIENLLYLDLGLTFLTGFFATGHHYYFIGAPKIWLIIGFIFSVLQLLPIILMILSTLRNIKVKSLGSLEPVEKITLGFILSSLFYHFIGAGLLGLSLAIPQINYYAHGTYLTSAHAHLALFGVFGFLVLGFGFWIVAANFKPSKQFLRCSLGGLSLLNLGLLMMGISLGLAGMVQTYLWRVGGWDFMKVAEIIRPYLLLRALSGLIFTAGDLLLCWAIAQVFWKNRNRFFQMPTFLKAISNKLS